MSAPDTESRARNPWFWVPSLYFTQGLPYVAVTAVSIAMYKNLKVSNTEIAFYTSWLGFPWIFKPLWSPFVDMFGRKRIWIVAVQALMGALFAAVAFTVPAPYFVQLSLALLFLLAFSSATHDIAADGFYLLAQTTHQQAAYVGVRSTFYRVATIAGQGGLVWLAGRIARDTGSITQAWAYAFGILTAFLGAAALYHGWALPVPAGDRPTRGGASVTADFATAFGAFFAKPGIRVAIFFLLVYRLAEAQALKLVQPFLLDVREVGGLGLTTEQLGIAYGTVGVASLLVGGISGGLLIARFGLKRMLWPMVLAMHVPIAIFLALALTMPGNFGVICAGLAVEQFGYGFGFSAYMVFMMMIAKGDHQTAHYAICTGFMAAGLIFPGMAAGWLQDHIGYAKFFAWVLVSTIPSFFAIALVKIDPAFGKKAA
jgi:PAT family beta-lactamase induction signal transducer AmpG